MKSIVITGSTRGIGFGLSQAFLARDQAVTISSRTAEAVARAMAKLGQSAAPKRIFGWACDVQDPDQVQSLWDQAVARYGKVDIWINNAGLSGSQIMIWDHQPAEIKQVIATNLLGLAYGSRVAVRGMLAQGHGAIYNLEGMGSDGRKHAGLSFYGMTKYATQYFNESLALELKDTPLIVGALRPGMVITDLITGHYEEHPEDLARVKKIFNIIASRVEDVTPWLADRILANTRSGVTINYTPTWKLLWRFISAPFTRRDLFADLEM